MPEKIFAVKQRRTSHQTFRRMKKFSPSIERRVESMLLSFGGKRPALKAGEQFG